MKAILLAAGRGSRLAPLTDSVPKCLVEVAGRSLLSMCERSLRAAGVGELAIVTGYRRERLAGRGPVEFHNPRWNETNMVASLTCAADWLRTAACLVSYTDIFYDPSAPRALAASPADLAIVYDRRWRALWERRFADPLADAETFRADPAGRLLEIGGRPRTLDEVEGQYMGLLKFTPAAWQKVEALVAALDPAARDRLDMTSLLSRLLAAGHEIRAIGIDTNWGEVDSPSDVALYESLLAAGHLKLP